MQTIDLSKLKEPIPYMWKVQTANSYGASCVAYIDSRDVQNKLDDVCGAQNWTNEFETIDGKLFCRIGITIDGKTTFKSDVGSESNVEKDKGKASDAFKRAAVMWGIGRFLYDLPIVKLPVVESGTNGRGDKTYKVMYGGKPVRDNEIITKMCNDLLDNQNRTDADKETINNAMEVLSSAKSLSDLQHLWSSLNAKEQGFKEVRIYANKLKETLK